MSVMIKGMEMPQACYECRMYQADIYYCSAAERDIDIPDSSEGRCSFCPLAPVPPHGRLGDLDDFAKRMKSLVEKAENDGFDLGAVWYSTFVQHIELTPTIIPAEEGE